MYSFLLNKQAGSNEQAGWKKIQNLINKLALINEQGRNFHIMIVNDLGRIGKELVKFDACSYSE